MPPSPSASSPPCLLLPRVNLQLGPPQYQDMKDVSLQSTLMRGRGQIVEKVNRLVQRFCEVRRRGHPGHLGY